ncbi:tyrosine protein kinase [Thalassobacillus devorans]|uniref:non-specific protein-tyrosine kinase n=1 Tax=Thalassobacillus devorans TaxID=279813 RepID=A0ABQ1NUK7_9BACI|nr:CpsD/CapB family tyrosine-protein kinase [Thalassobacillus devorans]NIK28593.1 capsular exopolysaccharide synthesis family protein [Thalassobacillus devorans]GGC85019.1 tyrosine protein kinase [Thalassobacillus devorans]
MRRSKKKLSNKKARTLIAKMNPRSPISEQYRTIRTNLQFASVDQELRTMMVTSAGPAEGKSLTVSNLAVTFAQQDKKVLLVDADMRKPTLHYTFRLDNSRGLSSVLIGDKLMHEVVQQSDLDNLDLMSSGPIPPNPSELLGSRAMENFLQAAKQSYDVVIFDTAPVLAVTDGQILSNICDGVLLVTRSKQTEIDAGKKAVDLLQQVNANVLGAVLNDVEQKKSNYYYYYGS